MTEKIDQEKLDELRQILGKIPGAERKTWTLEIRDRIDGEDRVTTLIDIRTGRKRQPGRPGQRRR